MRKNQNHQALFFITLFMSWGLQAADVKKECLLGRQIIQDDQKTFYVVQNRAPTLYMISRDLYGSTKNWQQLATWNHLSAPYTLTKGQRLEIKTPPTQDEEQGTDALIEASKQFQLTQKAQRLTDYKSHCLAEKKQVVAAPEEVMVAKTEIPAELKPAETLAPIPQIKDYPPIIAAEPEHASTSHESWGFSTSLISSLVKLSSKSKETLIDRSLDSNVSYGLELGIGHKFSEHWGLTFEAGLEHLQIERANEGLIENGTVDLLSLDLHLNYEINEAIIVSLGAGYTQRPFATPNATSTVIEAISIPEASLGGRVRLYKAGDFSTWLNADGIYSAAKKEKSIEAKEGLGYSAGFTFEYEMHNANLIVSPGYRVLKQDTHDTEEGQEAITLQVAVDW